MFQMLQKLLQGQLPGVGYAFFSGLQLTYLNLNKQHFIPFLKVWNIERKMPRLFCDRSFFLKKLTQVVFRLKLRFLSYP
jgi:hypothetical protein